jgi:hypothetical protein
VRFDLAEIEVTYNMTRRSIPAKVGHVVPT